jgi:hypothetical protein
LITKRAKIDGIIMALALTCGLGIISFKLKYPLLRPKYRPDNIIIPWMKGIDSG